jgi:hypothetical protein
VAALHEKVHDGRSHMLRALSIFGFGGGFLMISPSLRSVVLGGLATGIGDLDKYSPWSYIAGAVVGLLVVAVSLNRNSRPM